MITNPMELAVNRANTKAFIDANFELITLTPRTQQRTSTGGFTYTKGIARAPQRFHVIERNSLAMTRSRVPGGEQTEEEFTLLGLWDAAIAAHDIFTLNGRDWEVLRLERDNGYERRAAVIRYG